MKIQLLYAYACRAAAVAIALSLAAVASADPFDMTIGTIGDSYTDEYNAGLSGSRDTHASWTELLDWHYGGTIGSSGSGVFGSWGSWGTPRNTGYEYNWAQSGAKSGDKPGTGNSTTNDAIDQQLPGLNGQAGVLDVVYIGVGVNNYDAVDNATSLPSAQDLEDLEDWVVGDVQTIVNSVLASNPDAHVVVGNVVDRAAWPMNRILDNSLTNNSLNEQIKQAYSDSIDRTNDRIRDFANSLGIPVIDQHRLLENLTFGGDVTFTADTQTTESAAPDGQGVQTDPPQLTLAGFYMDNNLRNNNGDDRTRGSGQIDLGDGGKYAVTLYGDAAHPSTIWHGMFANSFLTALQDVHGVDLGDEGLLSWQQIMDAYWMEQGFADTTPGDDSTYAPLVDLDDFTFEDYLVSGTQSGFGGVFLPETYVLIPEPGTAVLLACGAALIATGRRRRRAA